jgi:hypothetical protein
MRMKKYLVVVLLLIAVPSLAADNLYYVRAGATGTGTGADWTNAYTTLPAVLSRGTTGATYYIADGNYEGYLFNSTSALADGTKIITIKKATVADHGTDTGWDNGYGDGQAVFQYSDYGTVAMAGYKLSTFRILTSYITIDGAVGSGSDPDDYGFKLVMAPGFGGTAEGYADRDQWNAVTIGAVGQSSLVLTDVTLQYLAAIGPAATKAYACFQDKTCSNTGFDVYLNFGGRLTNLTIKNLLSTHWNNNISVRLTTNVLIEGCYLSDNWSSATGDHGQNINLDGVINTTIRNNQIVNSTEFAVALHINNNVYDLAVKISGLKIYNNLFYGTNPSMSGFIATMGSVADTMSSGAEVHHNTVVGQNCGGNGFLKVGPTTDLADISYVYNNLFYDTENCTTANAGYTSGVIVHDYNAYLASTNYTAEDHSQVDATSESPFNTGLYTISTTWDAAQVTAEKASLIGKGKTDLGSPYDVDMAGNSRDASPDIGAYESGASADETAPTLDEVTPVSTPSPNQAPHYVFSSDEAGTVTYGGDCGNGSLSTAVVGNNTVEWNVGIGTYSNCTITVTDAASNASTPLAVTEFVITPAISSASKVIESGVTFMRLP